VRLLLLRHGQTTSNVDRHLDTAVPGADLTDLGREQAVGVIAALTDEPIDAVYCSPLVRTQQTVAPLLAARGLTATIRAGLGEVGAGELEMANDDASITTYVGTGRAWMRGELSTRMPGAVLDGAAILAAFDDVVSEAAQLVAGGAALFVSHAAIIRIWVATRATNVDFDFASSHPLGNTALVVLEGNPADGWAALSWEGNPITIGTVPTPSTDPSGAAQR
jgi:broad specificity phosphatase PhoE